MKGKCLCSAVKFELTEQIRETYYCHCRDCQILSGSAFRVFGIMPNGSLNLLSGSIATYTPQVERGFEMNSSYCSDCASPLFVASTRFPDIQLLLLSALNSSELQNPSFQIWCDSMVSWAKIDNGINSFPRGKFD